MTTSHGKGGVMCPVQSDVVFAVETSVVPCSV